MNTTRMQYLVAFIESHGNKVVSTTETTVTAEMVQLDTNTGAWATVVETFPATVQAARDWLGY
jgi:hypothetical protein